jgi:hypothetical protein
MAKQPLPSLVPVISAALLGGCTATTVDHPSLAPRAVERFTVAEPEAAPSPPPVALPDDASRQERAAVLAAQAQAADARFRAGLAEAEAAIGNGSGAAPGSEAWVQAQQALSRIETLREPVSRTLADLDALQIAAAETGIGTGAEAAFTATLQDVIAIDTREQETIATLRDRLATP